MENANQNLIETLKIMKELNGKGFDLSQHIYATVNHLLDSNGIPKEKIEAAPKTGKPMKRNK